VTPLTMESTVNEEDKDRLDHREPWIVRVWPYVRTSLQLAGMACVGRSEGLYLAAQALSLSGDLAVRRWNEAR